MKKIIGIFFLGILISVLWACTDNSLGTGENQTESKTEHTIESEQQSVETTSTIESEEESSTAFTVQTIPYQLQTMFFGGDNSAAQEEKWIIINDLQELENCFTYALPDETKGLLEKYDAQWFETNFLMITATGASSSFRLEINQISVDQDCLRVGIEGIHTAWEVLSEAERESMERQNWPIIRTDFQYWGFVVEIERQYFEAINSVSRAVEEFSVVPAYWEGVRELEVEVLVGGAQ